MSVVLQATATMPRASMLMPEPQEESEGEGAPFISYGEASEVKNGEDFTLVDPTCRRVLADGSESTFAVFGVLDGHNGASAAMFTRQNLVANVLGALRQEPTTTGNAVTAMASSRDEWLESLPRALVVGFEKTDSDFREKGETSGTTVTLVVVDGWTVTVASVGDSRCILVSEEDVDGSNYFHGGGGTKLSISELTVDHRLENNEEERERVTANGGQLGQLLIRGNIPVGPLRCWPGGLSLSRSIGDFDVGEFIIATPDVKQCKIDSRTRACRLIIASDGVWDAFRTVEKVATCGKRLRADHAAKQIVKQSVKNRGLRDDTTCLVIDILSPRAASFAATTTRQGSRFLIMRRALSWTSFQRSRRNESSRAGAAELEVRDSIDERRQWNGSSSRSSSLATTQASSSWECAACQKPVEDSLFELTNRISVHAGSFFSGDSGGRRVLCITCEMVEARRDPHQRLS